MSLEIERKFLVRDDGWRRQVQDSARLSQGYLANTGRCSVRVRVSGSRAWLSIKSMRAGPSRAEFEYEIPIADGAAIFSDFAAAPSVEKHRHRVPVGRYCFEVDEFEGENRGLVLAEVELDSEAEEFPRPAWLGEEVTDDARFRNFRLADQPFSGWPPSWRRLVVAGRAPGGGL
ncbi:MAG: CYTH domain-containing protein [Gammaproteobacteria bacterium]